MEFPILVFGHGFPDGGQQINSAKDAITLPNGERFGLGDYSNPTKLAEAEARGVTFKRLVDAREHRAGYVQGNSIDTVDGDTVTRTCEYMPQWTMAELLSRRISEAKAQAGQILSMSDWYIVRNAETGDEVPAGVLAYRIQVRERSDAIEADLVAIEDYDELLSSEIGGWPEE